jgi:glucan biosynthesis protein C
MATDTIPSKRNYYIDWLRLFAIMTIFLIHINCIFNQLYWPIKNHDQYMISQIITVSIGIWVMPLIFMVSAASIFYSIRSRSGLAFIKDKILRLLVPFIFGLFALIPPQVYLERLTRFQFSGSFFDFYRYSYFNGFHTYGKTGGNFPLMGMHLWYLLALFVFSLLFLPLFISLVRGRLQIVRNGFGWLISKPLVIFIPGLLIGFANAVIDPSSSFAIGGGWGVFVYMIIFVIGFMIFADTRGTEAIAKNWIASLIGALVLTGACLYFLFTMNSAFGTPRYFFMMIIAGMCAWLYIIGLTGLFMARCTGANHFLGYATEAVLPFYILHQTVIVIIGYKIVQFAIPAALKFTVISVSSFIVIMIVYEFCIRRWNITRFLFGMKPRR